MAGTRIELDELGIDYSQTVDSDFQIRAALKTDAEELIDWVYHETYMSLFLLVQGLGKDKTGQIENYTKIIACDLAGAHGDGEDLFGQKRPQIAVHWELRLPDPLWSIDLDGDKLVLAAERRIYHLDAAAGVTHVVGHKGAPVWVKHPAGKEDFGTVINRPMVRDGYAHILGQNGMMKSIRLYDNSEYASTYPGGEAMAYSPILMGERMLFLRGGSVHAVKLNQGFDPVWSRKIRDMFQPDGGKLGFDKIDLVREILQSYGTNTGALMPVGDQVILSLGSQYNDKIQTFLEAQIPIDGDPNRPDSMATSDLFLAFVLDVDGHCRVLRFDGHSLDGVRIRCLSLQTDHGPARSLAKVDDARGAVTLPVYVEKAFINEGFGHHRMGWGNPAWMEVDAEPVPTVWMTVTLGKGKNGDGVKVVEYPPDMPATAQEMVSQWVVHQDNFAAEKLTHGVEGYEYKVACTERLYLSGFKPLVISDEVQLRGQSGTRICIGEVKRETERGSIVPSVTVLHLGQ